MGRYGAESGEGIGVDVPALIDGDIDGYHDLLSRPDRFPVYRYSGLDHLGGELGLQQVCRRQDKYGQMA